jgi:hypothetical protein
MLRIPNYNPQNEHYKNREKKCFGCGKTRIDKNGVVNSGFFKTPRGINYCSTVCKQSNAVKGDNSGRQEVFGIF